MKKKLFNNKIFFLTIAFLSIIVIGSVSYAYYTGNPSNDNNQNLDTDTASLSLTYTDCATSVQSDCANISRELSPGESVTKTFRVTNTGTLEASYFIKFSDVSNTFVNNELVYSLSRTNNTLLINEGIIPSSSNGVTIFEDSLGVGESKEYRLTILFKNIESGNSNNNKGATFSLKVGITTEEVMEASGEITGAIKTFRSMVRSYNRASTSVIALEDPPQEVQTDEVCTNTMAYDGTADNNLRYVGANPCNYVSFNNELWRIIGVMNNVGDGTGKSGPRIKITRNESIGRYSYDTSLSTINSGYGVNEWSQSDLEYMLNEGPYWNRTSGQCAIWTNGSTTSCDFSSTGLTSEAKNLIGDAVWPVGTNGTQGTRWGTNANTYYQFERSNNTKICTSGDNCTDNIQRSVIWVGKVAIIYVSDYGFATSGGSTTTKEQCLTTYSLANDWIAESWGQDGHECYENDYLYNSNGRAVMNPEAYSSSSSYVFYQYGGGFISDTNASLSMNIHPTVYLKSNVVISGGTGTETDPYTLSIS